MTELTNLLQYTQLQGRFEKPISLSIATNNQFDEIVESNHSAFLGMALNVWNRIVQYNFVDVDPKAISDFVDNDDPYVYREIGRLVGEKLVADIAWFHAEVDDDDLDYRTIATLLVAQVFPNDLHLADVEFSDPYKPLPKEQKRTRMHLYEGLGMLGPLVADVSNIAKERNCDYITLTASSKDHIPLFEKYGFSIEDNPAANFYLKNGMGVPMEMKL